MHLQKIPFRSTNAFTEFFLKYMERNNPELLEFYSRFPELENFKEQINEKSKSFPKASRQVLVDALGKQYTKLKSPSETSKQNIQSLLDVNSFTVTTGHQLNIFTGPLYFVYKIVAVINACKVLKKKYPKYHFVPVYWMASEDHDYEEIKSFRLYEKKYTWETTQQGAVGRFNTKDLKSVLEQLPGDVSVFKEAYQKSTSLADAVRQYVDALFGKEGLIVIDADDHNLKGLFRPVIEDDLFAHTPFNKVTETNQKIESSGYKPTVNPRQINFFYLDDNLRARIEKTENGFVVVDSDLKFSEQQIRKKIEEEPEKFSPNVILRPLYQEMILPNLAYAGGPAELVYWLELKSMFAHFGIPFPMLMPRSFALVISKNIHQKLSKTGLNVQDFFEEKNYLFNHWVSKNSTHDLSLGKAMRGMEKIHGEIQKRCAEIDATLGPMVSAEAKRMRNALEKIEKKMMRAEKRLQSDKLRQIEAVKDALFPNGSLQERTDNFLNFFQEDPDFINKLIKNLDPFDFQFNVLSYD